MAGDDVVGSARITISLDDTGIQSDALALGRRVKSLLERGARGIGNSIRRDIQRALRVPVRVAVVPDLRRFDAQLLQGLRHIDSLNIPVAPDVRFFMRRLRAALRGEEISIRVVPDLDGLDERIRAHRLPTLTARVDADADSVGRLGSVFGRLGSVLGSVARVTAMGTALGALGLAAGAAAAQVVTLTAVLAPAVGIVAALPAAVAGAVAVFGALRLALAGVGDAFSAALTEDSEKFEESLKNLSPAARAAAREVRALRPAFQSLRSAVQDAFFEPLEGQITKLAQALGGPLRKGLSGIAGQFGTATGRIAEFLASARGVRNVETILAGAQHVSRGFAAGLVPVVKGLSDVAAAISKAFGKRLGDALAARGKQFGEWLTAAAESGRAVEWVSDAIETFRKLFTIVRNVGSIFGSVLDAARTAGGDLLTVIGNVTGSIADFLKSGDGQAALVNVFRTLGEVGRAVGPVLAELVRQVGALAPAFVPIVQIAGPALTGLLRQLGPALQSIMPGVQALTSGLAAGLAVLGPALQPLGAAISGAFTALSPLLPILGQLASIVATNLANGLRILTAVLQPVITAISGALAPILPQVAVLFQQVAAAAMPLAVVIGQQLGFAVQQLLPPILALVPQIMTGLLPAFQQLVAAVVPLLPPLMQLAVTALQPLIQILPLAIELFVSLVAGLTPFLAVVQQILPPALRLMNIVMSWVNMSIVIPLLRLIVNALLLLSSTVNSVVGTVASVVTRVIGFFQNLYMTLVGNSIIPDLINGILRWFARLPSGVVRQVASLVSGVVSRLGELPSRAGSALSSLASRVGGAISRATSSALSAARGLVADIVGVFAGLPSQIMGAIGDIGSRIMSSIRSSVPGPVRDMIPFLANGAIVNGPTLAMVGEAGPEVVIPLTRPQRARQLAEQSGLVNLLAGAGGGRGTDGAGPGITQNVTFHVTEVGDAETTARRVMTRMALVAAL